MKREKIGALLQLKNAFFSLSPGIQVGCRAFRLHRSLQVLNVDYVRHLYIYAARLFTCAYAGAHGLRYRMNIYALFKKNFCLFLPFTSFITVEIHDPSSFNLLLHAIMRYDNSHYIRDARNHFVCAYEFMVTDLVQLVFAFLTKERVQNYDFLLLLMNVTAGYLFLTIIHLSYLNHY